MITLRVISLALIVCLHVLGGAVLFRRIFPRESPWWALFVPALAVVSLLNFVEHVVALPVLWVILPFSSIGMVAALVFSRGRWKGLKLPAVLWALVFPFCLWIKCLQPDINFYNTEGLTDLNRILDFCLGDKVPAQDCWLPPYPHTGYYTFMHYGASVLKRLLSLDIGTSYNVGLALTNSLVLLAAAAAAYTLGRFRPWVAVVTLLVFAGGFTGSTPIDVLFHPTNPNPCGSIDVGSADYPSYPEFVPILRIASPIYDSLRLYTPGCFIYYSEFHANIGGHLVALLTVFGVAEIFRRRRSYFPWIWLTIAPLMAFITCTWFVFIVTLLAGPSLAGALLRGRRPPRWLNAGLGAGIGAFLLLPAALNLLGNSAGQPWYWSDSFPRDIPTIFIQWWPVYVPWLVLCFGWKRLSFAGRWLHLWLVPIVLSVELFYINQRTTMMEKTLGGAFGVGQAALYPLLFTQRGWLYRGLSVVIVVSGLISAAAWTITSAEGLDWDHVFCRLEGDHFLHDQESQVRLEQTLRCLHGKTVVAGRARHAWFRSPTVVAFSENRCYLGWTNAEEVAGHPVEANEREREINAFFDGKIADPLEFLARANASAVMVWPEDKISDGWVDGMKQKLGAEFVYINCKGEDADNAGLFIRRELAPNK